MTDRQISKRPEMLGLHHVALFACNYARTRSFYTDVMGMAIEWEPDQDNVYLTSGSDNLALHRANAASSGETTRLDHIGFTVATEGDVDAWYTYLCEFGVEIVAHPKTHRDGARSFYFLDPEGTKVQLIFHPPLAPKSQ